MAVAGAVVLIAGMTAACGGGNSNERAVLVDFAADEFAAFYLYNFPEKVAVHRGDTVVFKQTWTGEPHTVTGGTSIAGALESGAGWVTFFETFEAVAGSGANIPNPEDPGGATFADLVEGVNAAKPDVRDPFVKAWNDLRAAGAPLPDFANPAPIPFADLVDLVDTESEKALGNLPSAFDQESDTLAQNVSQPCFLREGMPPEDSNTPCKASEKKQPAFDGRQSFYNSGIIPYQGSKGNSFRVQIADDAALGTFTFYCAVHGFGQRTDIEIKPDDAAIPSQDDVAHEARATIKELTAPLDKVWRDANDDGKITQEGPDGKTEIEGPFAGLPGEEHTAINEFVPKTIKIKAGEPITWKMMGADHTISFNVPRYFPIMEFLRDGTVRINPKLQKAAGGAKPLPEAGDHGEGGVVQHDGGTFDGKGFWSSGLIGAQPYLEYTMRITKPATYTYACLLHPRMVGKIEVT
jgi:plastocyanin